MPKVKKKQRQAVVLPPKAVVRDASPFEIAVLEFLERWKEFKEIERNESTNEEIRDDLKDLDVWADRVEWQFRLQQINGPTVRVEMPPS